AHGGEAKRWKTDNCLRTRPLTDERRLDGPGEWQRRDHSWTRLSPRPRRRGRNHERSAESSARVEAADGRRQAASRRLGARRAKRFTRDRISPRRVLAHHWNELRTAAGLECQRRPFWPRWRSGSSAGRGRELHVGLAQFVAWNG